MKSPETDSVLARIQQAMVVGEFYLPPFRPLLEPDGGRLRVSMAELIERTERDLGVPFPDWLRAVYLRCNGFRGTLSLLRLDGVGGVLEFNLAIRQQDWAPSWFQRAILFMNGGGTWTMNAHWWALDGKLIEWYAQDGEQYTVLEGDLLNLLAREQERADRLASEVSKVRRNVRYT